MALFTEEQKIQQLPLTGGAGKAEDYLTTLMKKKFPTIPTQDVAGLTPAQLLIQSMMPGAIGDVTGAAGDAGDFYRSLLSDNYDVLSDPRFEALKIQAEENARTAETATKRAGEKSGMLMSTPTEQAVYKNVAATQSPLLAAMGDLLSQREGQRMEAAKGVQSTEAQKLSSLSGISNIADLQRTIEQMQADAIYNQALQQILAPYQYNAQIAQALLSNQAPYMITGGGLKDWAAGAAVLSPMLSDVIQGMSNPATKIGQTNAGVAPAPAVSPTFGEFKSAGPYG